MANFEGCSIGFWRREENKELWVGFEPTEEFDEVFDRPATVSLNLQEALDAPLPGNPPNVGNLIRQAVAALLNAAHPDVNYPLDVDDVIKEFQEAFDEGESEPISEQGDRFDKFNELFCPLERPTTR